MIFDLILIGANIITLNKKNLGNLSKLCNGWIGIKDGKISAIENGTEYPDSSKVWDLKGASILPGFCDSHVHGTLTGNALSSVDLGIANSIPDVLDMLAEECRNNPDNDIIIASNFLAENMRENRYPRMNELDKISGSHKLIIYHQSLHGCILNSSAFAASGLQPAMTGVETINEIPTGLVNDDVPYYTAVNNLMAKMDESLLKKFMKSCSDYAISKGITSIHSLNGGDFQVDMPGWILYEDTIPIHIVNYWETLDVETVKRYHQKQVGGCICLDGTRILRTMALNEPYSDMPNTRGVLYYKDDEIYNFISKAHSNDMQCAMHAAGERAIEQYITLLNKVVKEQGKKDLRHRIEHFSMPTKKHMEMAAEMQLALPMQPIFSAIWDDGEESIYKQRFGKERAERIEPIADIIKEGGIICGGSDSPVTPMNPLEGINACVNNPNPNRNISLTEALKIYTINGAWATREEHLRGTIEVGKIADLVILDTDPYEKLKSIKDISVIGTIINGNIEFAI
jgi:predicted amidohydrolase YtcJ